MTPSAALNWATAAGTPSTVDLDASGSWTAPTALVDPGQALPAPTALPVTLRGSQTAVAGTLSNLNLFDFITGSASFALTTQTVDVDLDGNGNAATGEQLNDASLMTIALSNLTLSVGISGVGLTLTGGSVGIAVLSAPVPTTGTDTRSWTAVSANNVGVALDLPGITATVSNVALRIGRASGLRDSVAAAPVNWVGADLTTNGLVDLDPAGAYTAGSGLVNPGATLPAPVDLSVKQRGDSLAISGTLANLNVFDFITGSANFAITRQAVDVDLDGDGNAATGEQLNDAGLLTIALDQLNVSIGAAGTGVSVTSGTLGVAILSAPVAAGDTRSWTAITGKDIGITLDVPGIEATVEQGSVVVNRASGLKNGVAPVAVNWAKADLTTNGLIDFNADAGYTPGSALVDPGANLNPAVALPIKVRGPKIAIAGKLVGLDIFGLITGDADFALQTSVVDVDFDGNAATTTDRLNDAALLTFALTNLDLTVGFGGVGLTISSGSLGIATIKPPAPAGAAQDNRSWTAVTGKDLTVTLTIPGIEGSVTSASIQVNRATGAFDPTPANPASGDEVKAVALNWATAGATPAALTVDLDGAGGWTAPTALVDPGAGLPEPSPLPIVFRGSQLAVSGSIVGLDLFGILTGGADFAVTSQLVDVDLDGSAATTSDRLDDASLVTFALSNLNLRLGTDEVGLQIGPGGSLGIASISAPVPATGADDRILDRRVGKDLAVSLDLPGITASVTGGALKINRVSGEAHTAAARPARRGAQLGDAGRRAADGGPRRGRRLDGADRAGRPGSVAAHAGGAGDHPARSADDRGRHAQQPQHLRLHHRLGQLRADQPDGRRRPRR